MRSKVTTPPAVEPVSLSEIKASLRITSTAEDTLLTQYITDARLMIERITGRKLINQTITAYYTDFNGHSVSSAWWSGHRVMHERDLYKKQEIELEFSPVQSITSLSTVESDNSETVVTSTQYYLDNYDDDMRSVIRPVSVMTLGSRNENNLKAVYVAGYGPSSSDVPSALRRAIIILAGQLYVNRGDCGDKCQSSCGVSQMINPYIVKHV